MFEEVLKLSGLIDIGHCKLDIICSFIIGILVDVQEFSMQFSVESLLIFHVIHLCLFLLCFVCETDILFLVL